MKKFTTSSNTLWSCLIALVMMMASQSAWAEYVKLTALSGTGGTGGEGYASLVDGKIGTKMGHSFDPNNDERKDAYIVVKAEKAVVPNFYFLVTGGDTGSFPTRNWKKWNIYGGNFESDADAKRDLENFAGWTLIDERDGDPLPQANSASANFQFNQADGETAYQYFWIEILESVEGSDVWLQMGEWGLGTYGDFEKYLEDLANVQTGTDEPIQYTIISGDRMDGSGEALDKLFDGDITTKWGNGLTAKNFGETTNGAYFIVKTSRAIAPTYYKLVTGTDNASWNHRNWNSWQIYGLANADVPSGGKPTRDSDKWVMLDKKDNISEEVLPDKNMFTVLFGLSEENTTEYQYFKVEIDRTMAGSGYMQMGEFSLGDEYTLVLDRNAIAEEAEADFSLDLFAEKALIDAMAEAIASVKSCTDPFALNDLTTFIDEQTSKINTSANNYAELITVRNQAVNQLDEDNVANKAVAYVNGWISETEAIAPNNDYPVGNFAYIKANRQLTGAEAVAEAKRMNEYLILNVKVVDDPIYVTYEAINGSGGFGGEDHSMLIDGDRDGTKWCSNSFPGWMIFKSSESIKPTYYGLVTGGDTDTYKDRNWKSWKIYAANFDSDEEATLESDKWVLIDEKNNVGTDILKTTNKYESYINLSVGCREKYQYFMIKDVYAWGGLMQMNEFTFYNQGNLNEYRDQFLSEFEDTDPEEYIAYQGYIDAYKNAYQILLNAINPPDVMKAYNELKEAMENLQASADLYYDYEMAYEDVAALSFESESMSAWQEGYADENEGPGSKYIRGTYAYIKETLSLNNEEIQAETAYLRNIRVAAEEEGFYILLGGHTEGQWGDGFYGHLININKSGEIEGGNDAGEVKWGGAADMNGNTYIIFRTLDKTNPFFYTLTTGNDTQAYYGRNWGTWYIYGANFEGDGDATKDAEGWELIDVKENVGQDRLHPVNNQPSYFGFSTETTEEYLYYKVVVTKAYEGSAIQMNELHFGTEEEFEEIKEVYINAAEEFEYDVVAEQKLIDEYRDIIEEIEECMNMEALFRANYKFETLRDKITASAAAYEKYLDAVEAAKEYLKENNLEESEAKTIFVNYLGEEVVEPSELYPNGSAEYIRDLHLLADSVVIAEIDFLETLKAAAVAAGYGKGMDVSSLIVNRTFQKAGEMLKDEEGNNIGREAEGWNGYIYRTATDDEGKFYAAEFCIENAKFDVNQTLTNLKNGYYKVTLNAGFRPNGDIRSYNYAAMAYANDAKTFVPVVREDMAEEGENWEGDHYDRAIYAIDVDGPSGDAATDSLVVGYVIWGCEGSAHAFAQERYAITLVAQVTDGILTIGVKNDGTTGSDWTAAGNFGLVYLGEAEEDAANALKEVAEYNAARINTLTETYKSSADAGDYSKVPNFGAAQKDALAELSGVATFEAEMAIGETMQAIYEAKQAYLVLYNAAQKVYDKWYEYAGNVGAEAAFYEVKENLDAGEYADAEAALAAKAQLYAEFPGYLQVKKANNADFDQEDFAYTIYTTGVNPSFEMTSLYEALEEDQIILAFDYMAKQDLVGGYFFYETPNLLTDVKEEFPTLPEADEWTTVYYNVSKGIKELQFGTATNHGIFWSICKATKDDKFELAARNFRFMTKAQMQAEGGTPLNGVEGDLTGDGEVNIADAVTVLELMANSQYDAAADLNGDGNIDISDFVTILDIMAQQ